MSKLRVHELAKELNKTNKELLDIMKEKGIEVKSHMSTLDEEQIDSVKKSFVQKKKNIVQVFRPQNTQNASRQGGKTKSKTRWTAFGNGTKPTFCKHTGGKAGKYTDA